MTFEAILVHAEPDPATGARLETAAILARRFDATLMGLGAQTIEWAGVGELSALFSGGVATTVDDQVQRDLKLASEHFERHAASTRHTWLALREPPAEAMARLSRSADLIVAGGAPLHDIAGHGGADTADLVLLSGRPVLVAPPSGGWLRAAQIVVAWKDRREARRAVADAMPFLTLADEVVVMEICDPDEFGEAQYRTFDVSEHLKRHGVKARPLAKISVPDRAGAELNLEAAAIGADLIVSGAYGHHRLQERVLGGLTRELLGDPQRFVLLSH